MWKRTLCRERTVTPFLPIFLNRRSEIKQLRYYVEPSTPIETGIPIVPTPAVLDWPPHILNKASQIRTQTVRIDRAGGIRGLIGYDPAVTIKLKDMIMMGGILNGQNIVITRVVTGTQ